MKRFLVLLMLILFSSSVANAQTLDLSNIKNLFAKPAKQEKLTIPSSPSGEMTKSEQANILYSENNINAAMEILLTIKESDRTAQDWLLIGNILQDQNKNSDAIFMYQRAITVDANFYKAYYNLANIYLEEEKPNLAIENYKKVDKLNPEFPYSYYNLGCAYLKLGNLNKAKIAFLKAIEIKNTEPDFHYNLAYTYKMLGKEKLAKQYLGFYNKLMENR